MENKKSQESGMLGIIKRLMDLPPSVLDRLPQGYEQHSGGMCSLKLGTLFKWATKTLDEQDKSVIKSLWPNQDLAVKNIIDGEKIDAELLEALIPPPVRTFEHLLAIEEVVDEMEKELEKQ